VCFQGTDSRVFSVIPPEFWTAARTLSTLCCSLPRQHSILGQPPVVNVCLVHLYLYSIGMAIVIHQGLIFVAFR
jgi:hypothetical protein